MDALKTIPYKGHKIEIWFDEYYNENPNEWDEGVQLVFYHRDFWVESDIISKMELKNWFEGEAIDQQHDYWIFPVSAYIHSRVALSLSDCFMEDPGGWDTSTAGAILISKREAETRQDAFKRAQDEIKTWNDILSGQVFRYTIDGEGGVCGYIGDEKEAIADAKSEVDVLFRKREEKIKEFIKHHVALEKRVKILEAF